MKIYSKIDWWVHLLFIILLALLLLILLKYSVLAILILAVMGYILAIYVNTNYTLGESELICRSGFYSYRIKYYNIKEISLSESLSIAPALSKERIAIKQRNTGKRKEILAISPKDRQFFIEELKLRIEQIQKY